MVDDTEHAVEPEDAVEPGHETDDGPAPLADLSYEDARGELAEVMSALESGGQSLEESLALWRRGEDLADLCQRWLDDAGRRLDEAIAARSDPSREG